ncbi:MAG: alkaline phosphatase family protein [Rikenellaceae bacterium]
MTKKIVLYIVAMLTSVSLYAQSGDINKPHLVVNIIISGMRAVDVERYQHNFEAAGIRKFYEEGLRYDNCQYSYKQTTTPVSLSTLSTGALPSTHGIVGYSWFDYVTNEKVDLIGDSNVNNVEYPLFEGGGYSASNLLVPTISDALIGDSPQSQAVTIALDPQSAIVTNGKLGTPFWFDPFSCSWASSDAFVYELPSWVSAYNYIESEIDRTSSKWMMSLYPDLYVNSKYADRTSDYILGDVIKVNRNDSRQNRHAKYYNQVISTPLGNDIVASFARIAVSSLELGRDEHTDLLNICFDASRNIVEKYGPESIEAEDMYYKLDKSIQTLMDFIDGELSGNSVVYVITSDHGTSPSVATNVDRFNSRQFEVILNGFLSVRYGNEQWVLAYENGAVYLNHNAVFKYNLNLAEVQNEAATFALQMQGVSHAITANTLSSSYFGNGYAQKIQSGFYPRRSGDVVLNLIPNWIESDESIVSQSGSMYNYDRVVPLMIYGSGITPQVISRPIDAISIAPTIAEIMHVIEPAASEGRSLEELQTR